MMAKGAALIFNPNLRYYLDVDRWSDHKNKLFVIIARYMRPHNQKQIERVDVRMVGSSFTILDINPNHLYPEYVEPAKPAKPQWSSVPESYDWMAQDRNGKWYAYCSKPITYEDCWSARTAWKFIAIEQSNPNWKDTLERRPDWGKSILESAYVSLKPGEYITMIEKCKGDIRKAMLALIMPELQYVANNICDMWKGIVMNNCPTAKTLEPLERIHAKGDRLRAEINVLTERMDKLDAIEDSVKWKTATDEIKNKAVEAANTV